MRVLSLVMLGLSAAGCGGSDPAADSGGGTPPDASPGGIWRGIDPMTGLNILAVIDETGDFRLIRSDLAQYVGTAQVQGQSISGMLESFPDRGTTFPDGSAHGTGSISGNVTEREKLRVNVTNQTDNGTSSTSSITFDYDSTYENKSSLAAVMGSYVEGSSGTVYAVDSTGHFSARQAALGCMVDGTVSILDPAYNVYGISYTYSSCTGDAVALNGVAATGLGIFNTVGSAAQVLIAVSYTVSGQKVGLIVELNRE